MNAHVQYARTLHIGSRQVKTSFFDCTLCTSGCRYGIQMRCDGVTLSVFRYKCLRTLLIAKSWSRIFNQLFLNVSFLIHTALRTWILVIVWEADVMRWFPWLHPECIKFHCKCTRITCKHWKKRSDVCKPTTNTSVNIQQYTVD